MSDPGPVVAVGSFAAFVFANFLQRFFVRGRIALDRNVSSHAAHREGAAFVAGLDAQKRVGAHEWSGHGNLRAVGNDEVFSAREFLDVAEQIIPPATVQTGAVFAQFIQNFLHLKTGKDRFDEDRGLDRALRNTKELLTANKDVVPKARFEMMFQLGEIEINAGVALFAIVGIVKKVEREIEKTARSKFAINFDMLFRQMPAARADDERRNVFVQSVFLAFGTGEVDRAADSVPNIELPVKRAFPRW